MRLLIFVFAILLTFAAPVQAEKRIALVIGNGDYQQISALANPENDAELIAGTLQSLNFEVVRATNADIRGMQRAIRDFGRRLRAGGADAVGLFYYAGHAVEARGRNFLLPLGAEIQDEADLEIEAVSSDQILAQMESAGARINLVILDACRNNPFKGRFRSAGRGLARVEISNTANGTLVAFAAGPGQVAEDGRGRNSSFTAALAEAMKVPGLKVEEVFKQVRVSVKAATGGRQVPWDESSIVGDFYFLPPLQAAPQPAPAQEAPSADREVVFWNSIEDSDNPAVFEEYLRRYPEGLFAGLARIRLNELKETETAALTPPSQPTPGFTVTEMDETYYAVKRSNLRGGPGTEFAKVGRLSPGDEIEVTGKVAGKNWYRIAMGDGKEAFVFASLLSERKPAKDQVAVGVYPEAGRQPGETFKDCPECPEMVVIPPGRFRMGDLSGGGAGDEKPVHAVNIGYKFAVGKYEVTFDEWDACVADGGCDGYRPDDKGWGRGRRPVIYVRWNHAKAYVRWLSGKTGQAYRLLSESEWEYVARAGTTTAYNTGSSISKGQANYGPRGTVPVGSYSPNAFGLHDVHGNIGEWTEDCPSDYSGAPVDGSAWLRGNCDKRVVRGGSWFYSSDNSASRSAYPSVGYNFETGFRVARAL